MRAGTAALSRFEGCNIPGSFWLEGSLILVKTRVEGEGSGKQGRWMVEERNEAVLAGGRPFEKIEEVATTSMVVIKFGAANRDQFRSDSDLRSSGIGERQVACENKQGHTDPKFCEDNMFYHKKLVGFTSDVTHTNQFTTITFARDRSHCMTIICRIEAKASLVSGTSFGGPIHHFFRSAYYRWDGRRSLAFDGTAWPVATVVGSYDIAPWDAVPVTIPTDPPALSAFGAQWVWTDVIPTTGVIPAGPRAFRRTFTPAPGQVPAAATIIISANDLYTLYVTIGSGSNFKVAQNYTVSFASAPSEVVLAVLVTNNAAGAAGLLVAMQVNMVPSGRTSCTAGSFLLADPLTLWKSTKDAIPDGFEQPGFDDSMWPAVVPQLTVPAVTIATVPPVTI
ncbi:hypothetical protein B0H14DRAFT_3712286 [Mycena olivaceomarginata]|nr:hypothetical protein B0H14DRAFT_3712286 [Mycena olivaceomarginata]